MCFVNLGLAFLYIRDVSSLYMYKGPCSCVLIRKGLSYVFFVNLGLLGLERCTLSIFFLEGEKCIVPKSAVRNCHFQLLFMVGATN